MKIRLMYAVLVFSTIVGRN